ncbi:uridine diphosphate-N-acetylglucosamine-binding protein YvcK [Shewanella marina]|uniref:uridine diphosphate-N-acetylglucosamine-binding protein YvcK n=1 Tax=Shewanella marina TaxID=487319 RepID=UPI0004708A35|nr:uridine diphosphate-N-acetylglucosamine-binding protein YvcK [Shewanella marina]
MQERHPLLQYQHIVAIGGGHGLGRLLAALDFLGPRLTGIVTTTDNGGSTGRLRDNHNCIAWGDLRNCLTQLAKGPSIGKLVFEYRFEQASELSGHNLGNLILFALDQLCVRPVEAINLIRTLLKVDTKILPMSEQPTHLIAYNQIGNQTLGEVEIDKLSKMPASLGLLPQVDATVEVVNEILSAEVIILGPGSFLTSIMPPLLLASVQQAIRESNAKIIFIDNLVAENSAAGSLSIVDKIKWCECLLQAPNRIDYVLCQDDVIKQQDNYFYYPLHDNKNRALHDLNAIKLALADLFTTLHAQSDDAYKDKQMTLTMAAPSQI